MNRSSRFRAACFTIFATLFGQLAVAVYACPALSPGKVAVTATSPASPCDGMDMDLPNLCNKHCNGAEQSQGSFAPAVGFIASFVVHLNVPPLATPIALAAPPALFQATAPPLTIRNCCFRI